MSVVIITLNIDTENSDETVPFCTLIEMLNQIKERIRTSNYTLDKYSTQTFDLMNGDDRAMVSIIGPKTRTVQVPVEPTDEMILAFYDDQEPPTVIREEFIERYKDMIERVKN